MHAMTWLPLLYAQAPCSCEYIDLGALLVCAGPLFLWGMDCNDSLGRFSTDPHTGRLQVRLDLGCALYCHVLYVVKYKGLVTLMTHHHRTMSGLT